MAGFVHRLDDLVCLQRDELHSGVVVDGETIEGFVAGEADDRASHARIGDWGAVAKEVAIEEKVSAKIGDGRCGGLGLHIFEVLVQVVVNVRVVGFGDAEGLLKGRVSF